jgi:isoleucyl-tRNA synthetase
MESIICDEVNVKGVDLIDSGDDLIIKSAKANFKVLGPKVGKLMGKLAPIIQSFSREQIAHFEQNEVERVVLDGQEIKLELEDVEIRTASKEGYATYTDADLTIALDLTLTTDLVEEGLARELVNRIQNLRKEIGLAVTDRIDIYIASPSNGILKTVKNKSAYIKNETLTVNILETKADDLEIKEITIGEESLIIGLKKNQN